MSKNRINSRRQGTPNPKAKRPIVVLPDRKPDGRVPKPSQATVDRLVAYEEERLGRVVCGAWKPVKAGICCRWPMRGHWRCKDDGGLSKRGIDSGSFSIGVFSEVVKDSPVADTYHRLLNDKRLMDLREHVGLATAELFQMLQEFYAGVPPQELWEECQRLRCLILDESGNTERTMPHVLKLLDVIEAGADPAAKREEIRKQQEHIRKLVTTERNHLEKERELMSMEAFVVNMAILAEGIKLFFQEEDILRFKVYMQANIMGLPGNATALIGTKLNPN